MSQYVIVQKKTGLSLIAVSVITYLLYLMVPVIPAYLPQAAKYLIYIISVSGAVAGTILYERGVMTKNVLKLGIILLFTALMYLGKWRGKTPVYSFMFQNLLFWIGLFFMPQLCKAEREETAAIGKIVFILMAVTLLTTIIGNIRYPNASRVLATTSASAFYTRKNIGGYEFVYGMAILLPYAIYYYRNRTGTVRIASFLTAFLIVAVSVFTEYTIAITVCLLVVLIEFLRRIQNRTLFFLALVLTVVIFLLSRNLIAELLMSVKRLTAEKGLYSIAERIDDIRDFVLGNDLSGDGQSRSIRYGMSLSAFLKSPVIGNVGGAEVMGGHSELLDILGSTGLAGFGLFCLLILQHVINIRSYIPPQRQWPCIESMAVFAAIAGTNTVLSSAFTGACLFCGPVIIYLLAEKQSVKQPEPAQKCKYIR